MKINTFAAEIARTNSVEEIEKKYEARLRRFADEVKKNGLISEDAVAQAREDLQSVSEGLSTTEAFNKFAFASYHGSAADVAVLLTKAFEAGMKSAITICESMLFLQRCLDYAIENDQYSDTPSMYSLLDTIEDIIDNHKEKKTALTKKGLEQALVEAYTESPSPLESSQAEMIVDDLVQRGILNAADGSDFISDTTQLDFLSSPSVFYDMCDKLCDKFEELDNEIGE